MQKREAILRSSSTPQQYKTLQSLCETIFPADADSGGAIEAGAPEFIDLLTSENPEYQTQLAGGLKWLDSTCDDRYGKSLSGLRYRSSKKKFSISSLIERIRRQDESLSQGGGVFLTSA